MANLTINKELQPFNGTGSIFPEVFHTGQISFDCDFSGLAAVGVAVTDPLSLGITLVIVFFVILLMAITISFVMFKIRKQTKCDKDSDSGKDHFQSGLHSTSPALNTIPVSSFMSETGDVIRHHMVPPELLSKRYKDQDMSMSDTHRPHRPDIIEREVVGKSPPPQRDDLNQHMKSMHQLDSIAGDLHDMAEHYDLENASSIAPSDIDIVYHYKSKCECSAYALLTETVRNDSSKLFLVAGRYRYDFTFSACTQSSKLKRLLSMQIQLNN